MSADLEKNATKPQGEKKNFFSKKCRDRMSCFAGCTVIWCIIIVVAGLIIGSVGASKYDHNIKIFTDPTPSNCSVTQSEIITEVCTCKRNAECQTSCFTVVWNVYFPTSSIITDGHIVEARKDSYVDALRRMSDFQVNSTYPCWYEHDKPEIVRWFGSSTYEGKLLLIIGWTMFGAGIVIGCLTVCLA